MPTRPGWMTLFAGAITVVFGRLFAIIELFVLGVGMIALVVLAVAIVRLRRATRMRARRVSPRRVHAGETARVELVAANRGRGRTPVLELRDPVSSTHGAHLQLAPLAPDKSARAAYRLPTSARGQVIVGPMVLTRTDMLGLAVHRAVAAPATTVTVLPRWHTVAVPGKGADRGPLGQHLRLRALGREGDEFRTLREYVPGDDLRKIHWKASARGDDLKVREMDVSGLRQIAVVLDQSASSHNEESFEMAITAAASIVLSAANSGRDIRFATSNGLELSPSTTGMEPLLEYLATVTPSSTGSVSSAVGAFGSRLSGGLLILVSGALTSQALTSLRGAAGADATVGVACQDPMPASMPGVFLVNGTTDDIFVASWNRLVGIVQPQRSHTRPGQQPVGEHV
jgi:uncharacterized protein (DUF58 family)